MVICGGVLRRMPASIWEMACERKSGLPALTRRGEPAKVDLVVCA